MLNKMADSYKAPKKNCFLYFKNQIQTSLRYLLALFACRHRERVKGMCRYIVLLNKMADHCIEPKKSYFLYSRNQIGFKTLPGCFLKSTQSFSLNGPIRCGRSSGTETDGQIAIVVRILVYIYTVLNDYLVGVCSIINLP